MGSWSLPLGLGLSNVLARTRSGANSASVVGWSQVQSRPVASLLDLHASRLGCGTPGSTGIGHEPYDSGSGVSRCIARHPSAWGQIDSGSQGGSGLSGSRRQRRGAKCLRRVALSGRYCEVFQSARLGNNHHSPSRRRRIASRSGLTKTATADRPGGAQTWIRSNKRHPRPGAMTLRLAPAMACSQQSQNFS